MYNERFFSLVELISAKLPMKKLSSKIPGHSASPVPFNQNFSSYDNWWLSELALRYKTTTDGS
jgi:hypothetical protein